MFDKKPKDRLAAHKEFEDNNAKMKQYSTKAAEEEAEVYAKISDEIRNTGTIELRELWSKYSANILVSKLAHMIDITSMQFGNHVLEKQLAHNNLKCMKDGCDDYIVPDGVYNIVGDDKENPEKEFVKKENCFVCLTCGSKYKLVEA